MGKTVGITYDLKADWEFRPEDPEDQSAEFDKPETLESVIAALERGGHTVRRIGNVYRLLEQIDRLDVDIVFNICEGRSGRNRESQVPVLLEMYGIPFVGADGLSMGITLDKVMAKKIFISEEILTPRYFLAFPGDDLEKLNTVGFPLIVKTRYEGSSKGITRQSRVENLEALTRQVRLIHEVYRQPALVEEFIAGIELTVPVMGNRPPQAMPVVQVSLDGRIDLGDDFYTYDRVVSSGLKYLCPAEISRQLTEHVQSLALRAYKSVECRDFGRVDIRVDRKGSPYVLEINPLPVLDPTDAFGIFPVVYGSNYDETINRVLDFALERYGFLEPSAKGLQVTVQKK